jgi:hypothetical protein
MRPEPPNQTSYHGLILNFNVSKASKKFCILLFCSFPLLNSFRRRTKFARRQPSPFGSKLTAQLCSSYLWSMPRFWSLLLYASSISQDFHQNHRTKQKAIHHHFYNNITPICHSKYNTQMAPTTSTTAHQHHRRLESSSTEAPCGIALFNGIFMVVANAVSNWLSSADWEWLSWVIVVLFVIFLLSCRNEYFAVLLMLSEFRHLWEYLAVNAKKEQSIAVKGDNRKEQGACLLQTNRCTGRMDWAIKTVLWRCICREHCSGSCRRIRCSSVPCRSSSGPRGSSRP